MTGGMSVPSILTLTYATDTDMMLIIAKLYDCKGTNDMQEHIYSSTDVGKNI